MPEPNSMMLLGSGVVVPVVVVVVVVAGRAVPLPISVKDSEGIVPTELSEAEDGTAVFIPVDRIAVADNRVLQVQPVATGVQSGRREAAGLGADVVSRSRCQTQPLCVKLTVPLKKLVPPNSLDVIETSAVCSTSPGNIQVPKLRPLTGRRRSPV